MRSAVAPVSYLLLRSLLASSLLAGAGCATPDAKKTPAQYVRDNSNLLDQLRSYADSEQREGIARIQRLGRDMGSAVVRYLLDDPTLDDYRVEVLLARILADWKDPRAIKFLLRNLTVQDMGAARRVSEGLVVFGDNQQVLDALAEMLGAPAPGDRMIAAETLARIDNPKVPDIFLARWKGETDPGVRGVFLVRILKSRHPGRKVFLADALTDADSAIRAEAWRALKKYPDVPRADFAPDGPLEDRARAVAALRIWAKGAKK